MNERKKGEGPTSSQHVPNDASNVTQHSNAAATTAQTQNVDPSALVHEYWSANLRLLGILLSIWFVASFVFGILLVDVLDQFRLFGFKLGFWFAQQGSIYIFIALIFIYAFQIHKIERRFGVSDD